jgi:hypothetical protein
MAGIFRRREDYLLERTNLFPSTSLKIAEVVAGDKGSYWRSARKV